MPFDHQRNLMRDAGFAVVDQYIRMSQMPLENVTSLEGSLGQIRHGFTLAHGAASGHTSIVVARKRGTAKAPPSNLNESLLSLAVSYDKLIKALPISVMPEKAKRTMIRAFSSLFQIFAKQ
jgi:hypothetical protein